MNEILPHVFEMKEGDASFVLGDFCPPSMPLELEIGCGNGRFLVANAAKHPDRYYIGIERMIDRLRKCSRKARLGALHNIAFVRVEAGRFVREVLPAGSVSAFYLFFPDPWPKRRHHKNRFFQREMCDTLIRIMKPGGHIYISTDHEEYFKTMDAFLDADDRFERVPVLVRQEDEQTDFEQLFRAKQQPIYDCAFRVKTE